MVGEASRPPEPVVADRDRITASIGARQQLAFIAPRKALRAPQRVREGRDTPGIVVGIAGGATGRVRNGCHLPRRVIRVDRLAAQGIHLAHDAPRRVIGDGTCAIQRIRDAQQPPGRIVPIAR